MGRAAALLALLALVAIPVAGGEQTPSFTLSLNGAYTWTFGLGIGDRELLSRVNLSPWVPFLRQGFAARVEGRALDIITVRANLDSSRGIAFQDFGIYLDADRWKGVLGNFSLGSEYSFAVPPRRLLGAQLSYHGDGFVVQGVASRSLGKYEVRIFHGERGHTEVTFYLHDPAAPWRPAPYRNSVEGLYYYVLARPFIPKVSEASLVLDAGPGLWAYLDGYGLGYLREVLEGEPEHKLSYRVIRDGGRDVLLLRSPPEEIARRWVEDAIQAYNEDHGLSGAAAREYPFVVGSETELKFLQGFVGYVSVAVDGEEHPLGEGKRRRYLDLGETDVAPEGFSLEIRYPGSRDFVPFRGGSGYSYTLFPDAGILRIDFPDEFFSDDAALRASFDYTVSRNIFFLSPVAGIVPDSERVYRNGKRLRRGEDYAIDYEAGTLQLFSPLKEGDELRVEYEVPYGLGAGPQEDFLGVVLSLGKGADLFVFRSAEEMEVTPTTPTMPNAHTVGGLRLAGGGDRWSYSLLLGASENVFPPGKNERIPGPNRVTDIAAVEAPEGTYVVFSHYRGISVFHDGFFSAYRSGHRVHDLLPLAAEKALLLAEAGDVVLVDLTRAFPFDWRESYTELPLRADEGTGKDALCLAADDRWVYVATDVAVIRFPRADLPRLPEIARDGEEWDSWKREHWAAWVEIPEGIGEPRALLAAGTLLLGTDKGLFRLEAGAWRRVPDVDGAVSALVRLPEGCAGYPPGTYAAAAGGIYRLEDGAAEPVLPGVDALSLAFAGDSLWYGTPEGLFRAGGEKPLYGIAVPVTALGTAAGTLWVGTEAVSRDEDPAPDSLSLWSVDLGAGSATEYPDTVNRILPTDPGHYRDIPPAGNTDRGLIAQFSWWERTEGGRLSWYVRTSSPGYEPLDRPPPGDTHAVGFSYTSSGEGLEVSLRGDVGINKLFTRPVTNLSGGLSLAWSPGPKLSLNLSPKIKGLGTPETTAEMGYSLAASWDNGGGGLLASISARTAGGIKVGTGGRLEVVASLKPIYGFTVRVTGRHPYALGMAPAGRQGWSATVAGAVPLFGTDIKVTFKEDHNRDLGPHVAGNWRMSRSLSLQPQLGKASLGAWSLRPSASLTFGQTDAESRLALKGAPSLEYSPGEISLRLTTPYELGLRYVGRTGTTVYSASLSPRLVYTAGAGLKATATASFAYELIQQGGRLRGRFSFKRATVELTPTLWEGFSPGIVLGYTPGRLELSLRRTELEVYGLPISVSARITWELSRNDLRGEVKFSSRPYRLAGDWSLSLEGGYLVALCRGAEFHQGIYLKGNLSLAFSF